jgi:hypothetical protein
MMKLGRQKDCLERTTQPLPDPIKGRKEDEVEVDEDVVKHIRECLTELVSQLDVDNNLGGNEANHDMNELSFMSLSDLRGNGKDQCWHNCIKPPEFHESNRVYEFAAHTSMNTEIENNPVIVTSSAKILSKSTLTILSIQSIKRNVEQITELAHIRPTGTAASIQKWAQLSFQDRTMGAVG